MIFLLLLPVLLALLINIIFSTIPFDLPLGVVSDELPDGFSQCKGGRYDFCSNLTQPLACGFWNYLSSETLALVSFPIGRLICFVPQFLSWFYFNSERILIRSRSQRSRQVWEDMGSYVFSWELYGCPYRTNRTRRFGIGR